METLQSQWIPEILGSLTALVINELWKDVKNIELACTQM
jgi:hypothetical protein